MYLLPSLPLPHAWEKPVVETRESVWRVRIYNVVASWQRMNGKNTKRNPRRMYR